MRIKTKKKHQYKFKKTFEKIYLFTSVDDILYVN